MLQYRKSAHTTNSPIEPIINANKKSADFDRTNLVSVTSNNETKFTNISVLNLQSACNKVDTISDFILENDCDIAFLTEIWVSDENEFICQQFTPNGYANHHVARVGKAGGCVGIMTRNSITTTPLDFEKFKPF